MNNIDNLAINALRVVSTSMISKAKSGHPGICLGSAPILHTLFTRHLLIDSSMANWPNRDRFVLSAGHGSAILYTLLHLSGFDISVSDLKQFRQKDAKTAGHPEYGHTPGVEVTTGPLGQGLATAVGMAISGKYFSAKFNKSDYKLFNYNTYVLCGDGDLQEGLAMEACSLAGHLALNNLIVLYDSNDIQLDGPTSNACDDNIKMKFDSEMLSARAELKEIIDDMRKEKTEKIARRSYSRLTKLEQSFKEKLDKYDEKNKYAPIDFENLKIGDKLQVKDIHQTVTILSMPDKKGNIFVQMGNIKTKIDKEKLAPYDKKYEKKSSGYTPVSLEKFELKRTELSNRLDLRGKTVEDSLDELELFLDQASLANFSEVSVIHGHGTGALKSAVRDFLKTSPYVKEFRPGGDGEGGDGISVISLR